MARFRDPAQAVRTALEMRERIEHLASRGTAQLGLRIGLHRGPAIAVSVRDQVDYFGQTVNAASRIQAAAMPGEIVLSDDVFRGLGVADLLLGYDLVAERRKLRGVSTEMLLHRVAVAPRDLEAPDLSTPAGSDVQASAGAAPGIVAAGAGEPTGGAEPTGGPDPTGARAVPRA
jgi:class 3 adenylate cyclase